MSHQSELIATDIEAGFKISPEQLSESITARTRLFILNSPSNPTGAAYSQRELRALGSVLAMVQAVRGLLHVATDLDGQPWRSTPRGEAPRAVHALVAAVIDRVLDTLADPGLRAAFEVADPLHPPGHRAWRGLSEASKEALHHAILTLRRGHAPTMALDAALDRR